MKMFKKNSIVTVVVAFFVFAIVGLVSPNATLAATSPTLVGSSGYSVLGGAAVTNTGATTATGAVGVSPLTSIDGDITATGGLHSNDAGVGGAIAAQADVVSVFGALDAGTNSDANCTAPYKFGAGVVDLAGATLAPGVYCADSFTLTGILNLTGSGVWVFKTATTLITSVGSSVTGGDPCNTWWRIGSAATIGATSSFRGNIVTANAADTTSLNNGAILNGRVLTQAAATVALHANTISGPVCTAVTPPSSSAYAYAPSASITVVKHVVGGAKINTDFPLFVDGNPVISGVVNNYSAPATHTVTETNDPNYTRTFSGTCPDGIVNLTASEANVCIITNTYITPPVGVPPLIDVVKVPSPLSLPNGPGSVNYTYTLTNIGTVPVTDITMVGDTCSPIALTSGDTNSDSKLDLNETWIYNCSTTLTETHTNTVTTTGWANGISATDIASATVVVGLPIVPPLIHITKIPNPLTLGSGGGMVTYTKRVTNPGTVPLSNVTVTDDKCSPITYISGDTNNDSKLDTTETWTYTCRTNLIRTTVNTATATGTADGLTAIDFAIATVIVAAPGLPSTGLPPAPWNIVIIVETLILILTLLVVTLKKRKG